MSNKVKKIILPVIISLFWILIWFLLSLIINNTFLFPSPIETLKALFVLLKTQAFYKVVFYSLLRVSCGVALGVLGGVILAISSHAFPIIRRFISPIISIIKATPVVTFIVLLWISMSGNSLTVFVAFLMVMPIVWQNVLDGYSSIPKELTEVASIFEFSRRKRFKILILPVIFNYLFPAIITSIGLAWKAEIAAEIIAYTKVSIGQYIYDARYNLETPTVFAWVSVIVLFSILLEASTKFLLRRLKK